jgi:hypothetical protein
MVHGRARASSKHTLRVAANEVRLMCTYVCVCMCVDKTYDATIDTWGERNRV